MREEIEYARKIQLSMLPQLPPDIGWVELAAASLPATEVGGDYYDYFRLSGSQLALVIGDVSGHGLASGLLLSGVRSCLYLLEKDLAVPVAVLDRLNPMVRETTDRRTYVTLLCAVLDRAEDGSGVKVTVASAGHPPLLCWDAQTAAVRRGRGRRAAARHPPGRPVPQEPARGAARRRPGALHRRPGREPATASGRTTAIPVCRRPWAARRPAPTRCARSATPSSATSPTSRGIRAARRHHGGSGPGEVGPAIFPVHEPSPAPSSPRPSARSRCCSGLVPWTIPEPGASRRSASTRPRRGSCLRPSPTCPTRRPCRRRPRSWATSWARRTSCRGSAEIHGYFRRLDEASDRVRGARRSAPARRGGRSCWWWSRTPRTSRSSTLAGDHRPPRRPARAPRARRRGALAAEGKVIYLPDSAASTPARPAAPRC